MNNELQFYQTPQTEQETTVNRTDDLPVELQGAIFQQLLKFTGYGGGKFKQLSVKLYEVVWERYEDGWLVNTFRTPIIQTPQGNYKLLFENQEIINNNLQLNKSGGQKMNTVKPLMYNDPQSYEEQRKLSDRELDKWEYDHKGLIPMHILKQLESRRRNRDCNGCDD